MFRHGLKTGLALLLVAVCGAPAAEPGGEYAELEKTLRARVPQMSPDHIGPSPIPGLLEVRYGAQLYYATLDGRFLIDGSIYDLEKGRNVTAPRLAQARTQAISAFGEDNMVVFAPEQPRHTVTVFTDLDCPYCQRLHRQMDEYHAKGIAVRYVLFPRAQVGAPSYNKAVSVWCAKDRRDALTQAKSGAQIEAKTCTNPVEQGMQLGRMLGINGTPTIVTQEGRVLPGYVPPDKLAQLLDSGAQVAGKGQ
ncbi:MAG: DsbC family protein [Gammaproteobacteria bacterium]|nr:DsbC family protein [Gammaproteobacteria bacterium]NIR96759.1 DsbC family protein [Gammaproteobacteria bacterium]NIT62461.1 DsbC family protein [Gammaproteobacteria bacterium]NIV19394.1 thioredoxin fold domain-containing protein [Gammaproteobacteria bacterium]NIX10465.1 thioredoxin fold domain-containing protein [Gammaproteobacteria bacterium]